MTEPRSEDETTPDVADSLTPPVDPIEGETAEGEAIKSSLDKRTLRIVSFIVIAVLAIGGYFLISNANKSGNLSQIQGKVALSDTELRDLVVSKHLIVYWAGPLEGAKYTLLASTPGSAYVKYLPGGVGLNDTKTFRAIGTYTQKNAFTVAKNAGTSPGNMSFINADGNAVFYSKGRPTNVYVGIKGKDIQVEVFDPADGQALGLVLIRNQVRQIS